MSLINIAFNNFLIWGAKLVFTNKFFNERDSFGNNFHIKVEKRY